MSKSLINVGPTEPVILLPRAKKKKTNTLPMAALAFLVA